MPKKKQHLTYRFKQLVKSVLRGVLLKHPLKDDSITHARLLKPSNNNLHYRQLEKHFSGKLLLRNEIHLHDELFQTLLEQHYFKSMPGIRIKGVTILCRRCNNDVRELFGELPCHDCQRTHLYCRKCINMGRVRACDYLYYWADTTHKWPKIEEASTWDGKLTAHQLKAANRITTTIQDGGELLVWAVTGSGKTEMLYPGISDSLASGKRVCIATPRADVVRELLPRIQRAFGNVRIQGLYGDSRDKDGTAQLIIATTHQLLRYKEAFDVLIIDEIDAFPFHNDQSLQHATMRAAKKNVALIYLTATPRKKQKYQMKIGKLPHVFVPIRFHEHPLIIPQLRFIGNFKRKLKQEELPENFIKWIKKRENTTRQMLIFVPTIPLMKELIQPITELLLEKQLINSENEIVMVHAADPQRTEKVEAFRNKAMYALITTTILERGVTFPEVDVVVLDASHMVFDEPALIQIAGRAGRSPTDPYGEVVFFHDGKTNAMMAAITEMMKMNKRAQVILQQENKGR